MTSATLYPFQKCVRGHDLTGDESFIAQPNGNRRCRICVAEDNRGKKRKSNVANAFDGGNA